MSELKLRDQKVGRIFVEIGDELVDIQELGPTDYPRFIEHMYHVYIAFKTLTRHKPNTLE